MQIFRSCLFVAVFLWLATSSRAADYLRQLQAAAIQQDSSSVAHWGYDPAKYTHWGSHTNRLIPVYTYGTRGAGAGVDLTNYTGTHSPYRSEAALQKLYGYLPEQTLNASAEYLDQTNLYDLQMAAIAAGKRHMFLVIFDGMDWQTTRCAAIYNAKKITYDRGRGRGTHFQDYNANDTSQFAFMVTSPHNEGTNVDTDKQLVTNPGGTLKGGYDVSRGGSHPWSPGSDPAYLVSMPKEARLRHAYTDSSCSATSMTAGIKTYNGAVNVDSVGRPVLTVAHHVQEKGWAVGAVTSVPISHATPAAAYAHNVERDDYQDLSRDMLGLPSISHPQQPLSGLDVALGCGYGIEAKTDKLQGTNFVPGNKYLTVADMQKSDVRHGGRYVVAQRTAGVSGAEGLKAAAEQAIREQHRLLGFYGIYGGYSPGNLPLQTADGDFQPAPGRRKEAISYTPADLRENPTLADMTAAAIRVLERNTQGFWVLVEAGDVDWANHDNNLDSSIGAVNSGDAAVRIITEWVERSSNWTDSLLIVTADHGHYLMLDRPQMLLPGTTGERQP